MIIRGKPATNPTPPSPVIRQGCRLWEGAGGWANIKIVPHLSTEKIKQAILSSDIIICRSGYSNIMDLITLNKKAILVPTPGQTEQEYLSKYYKEKGVFYSIPQDKFDIKAALDDIESFSANVSLPQVDLLDEEVKTLMFLVIDYDER